MLEYRNMVSVSAVKVIVRSFRVVSPMTFRIVFFLHHRDKVTVCVGTK